jgi:hypothetical protein
MPPLFEPPYSFAPTNPAISAFCVQQHSDENEACQIAQNNDTTLSIDIQLLQKEAESISALASPNEISIMSSPSIIDTPSPTATESMDSAPNFIKWIMTLGALNKKWE